MRKIVVVLLCSIVLYSCDPEYCIEYIISNKTANKLELVSFTNGVESREWTIRSGSIIYDPPLCNTSKDIFDDEIPYRKFDDSIQVKSDGILVKTYYPNDKGKSIYNKNNKEHWKLVKKESSLVEFVFEITEGDLKWWKVFYKTMVIAREMRVKKLFEAYYYKWCYE